MITIILIVTSFPLYENFMLNKKILRYLDDNYNSFSKSFKKIAEYIKYNQSIISFISINELAKETETSPKSSKKK